jgi:hypothetical protein
MAGGPPTMARTSMPGSMGGQAAMYGGGG